MKTTLIILKSVLYLVILIAALACFVLGGFFTEGSEAREYLILGWVMAIHLDVAYK